MPGVKLMPQFMRDHQRPSFAADVLMSPTTVPPPPLNEELPTTPKYASPDVPPPEKVPST